MMTQKSLFSLTALCLVLILALTACGGDDDSEVVERPVIRLQVGDQTFSENVYSYCWPESADNLACDMDSVALAQPIRNVPIGKDDDVRFVIQGDAGQPSEFTATLLDGPGGVQDLSDFAGAFDVQLQDNLYRVQVDARYDAVEGKPAYVSYVFGLEIAGIIVPTPTPVPTDTPTATPEPTATLTPTATWTPTPAPTDTPEPVPTDTPARTAAPTVEPEETEAGAQAVVPGAETPGTSAPSASPPAPEPTTEIAAVATAVPTVEIPAAATSTPVPEAVASPTAEATEIPPVVTLVGPATTATPLPSAPALTLRFAGRDYSPAGYRFCPIGPSGEPVCVDLATENPFLGRIAFARGSAGQISIDGPRPTEVEIKYLTDTGIQTGQPEVRPGDNTILFIITPEAGSYIMAIRVTWGTNEVTYYFRVSVSG